MSRYSRIFLANALSHLGTHLLDAIRIAQEVTDESRADGDRPMEVFGLLSLGQALASTGHPETGLSAAEKVLEISSRVGGFHEDTIHAVIACAAPSGAVTR